MNDNLKLWDSVCVTDPDVTKGVNIGQYKYTGICAQSQIKVATSLWGPMGDKWGVRDEGYEYTTLGNINFCLYTAILYFPDGEISIHSDCEIIHSTGKWKGQYNEDFSKKMATDALTKGLSKRGFNADIFEGKFDDNKYVQEQKAKFEEWTGPIKKTKLKETLRALGADIKACTDTDQLGVLLDSSKDVIEQAKVDLADWWSGNKDS
ncbi:hypothetical protein KA005_14090, partial [bacterium]|nr:hypothetical protein [bacterium]